MGSITVPASMENLHLVMNNIEEFLIQEGCQEQERDKISISVEELFTNVASYAYHGSEKDNGQIRMDYFCSPLDGTEKKKKVTIQLSDWGIPYNPFARKDPDITLPIEERPIGGLGVYMVKEFMDKTEYIYKDGCNITTITKEFQVL